VTLMFSASLVFVALQKSMNKIFESQERALEGRGLMGQAWGLVRKKLLNIGMLLTFIFISIVSLLVSSVISLLLSAAGRTFAETVILLLNMGTYALLFAAIFKWMPDKRMRTGDAFKTAVLTSILFSVGKT